MDLKQQEEKALTMLREAGETWIEPGTLFAAFDSLYKQGKVERRRSNIRESGLHRYRLKA